MKEGISSPYWVEERSFFGEPILNKPSLLSVSDEAGPFSE